MAIFHCFLLVHQRIPSSDHCYPLPIPAGTGAIRRLHMANRGQLVAPTGRDCDAGWILRSSPSSWTKFPNFPTDLWHIKGTGAGTLWLCQNSYWTWQFIVDFPIEHGDFPFRSFQMFQSAADQSRKSFRSKSTGLKGHVWYTIWIIPSIYHHLLLKGFLQRPL